VYLSGRAVPDVYVQVTQVVEQVAEQVHHVIDVVAEALAPIVVAPAQHDYVLVGRVDDIEVGRVCWRCGGTRQRRMNNHVKNG